MRRRIVVAVAATLSAVLLGAPAAHASGSNFFLYAGYDYGKTPVIGSSLTTTIRMVTANVYVSDGHAAAWVGVDENGFAYDPNCQNNSNNLGIAWIQAGMAWFNPIQPQFYIEYKVGSQYCAQYYYSTVQPALNTNYTFSIVHVASGQWKATANGWTLGTITTGGSMASSTFTTEGLNDTIGQTAAIDSVFSSIGPWSTADPAAKINLSNDETFVSNVTSNGFEGKQLSYNGSCYPKCNSPVN